MQPRKHESTKNSLLAFCFFVLSSVVAAAQTPGIQVAGHASVLRISELDTTGIGIGGDVVWPVTPVVAVDGALTWFPGSWDVTKGSFESQDRSVGLVGLRATVARANVDLFARGRVGFLRFAEQPPVVCILIFPPPLGCQLAAGYTAFASEFGGGASFGIGEAGRLRAQIEAGDLLVRYGFESLRPNGEATHSFISHNLLLSAGLHWRF